MSSGWWRWWITSGNGMVEDGESSDGYCGKVEAEVEIAGSRT